MSCAAQRRLMLNYPAEVATIVYSGNHINLS
ncbi:MAG: hypothetical protein ACI8XZ_005374, partial [Gammaproteobacteria bacterium]